MSSKCGFDMVNTHGRLNMVLMDVRAGRQKPVMASGMDTQLSTLRSASASCTGSEKSSSRSGHTEKRWE
jgi:hypothetical protein